MDVAHLLAELATGGAIAIAVSSAVARLALRLLSMRRASRSAIESAPPPPPPPPPPPSWSLTLLVEVDEDAGLFRPSVQLRGSPLPWDARIRLELVEGRQLRLVKRRSLPPWAIGAELPLPAFPLPDGAEIDEVLGWHWDVVIEDERRERARWREHPAPAGALNEEGEVDWPAFRSRL